MLVGDIRENTFMDFETFIGIVINWIDHEGDVSAYKMCQAWWSHLKS